MGRDLEIADGAKKRAFQLDPNSFITGHGGGRGLNCQDTRALFLFLGEIRPFVTEISVIP